MTDLKKYIDLHVHSNFSDGAFSPTELIAIAAETPLITIALADHDTVSGISEALSAGAETGIEVIPAVELSVRFLEYRDVHLLGYGIDYNDNRFLEKLNEFRIRRERRNVEILVRVNQLLKEQGRQPVGLEEVLLHARGAIGRPHIARALLKRGYVATMEEAFQNYLIPCNVPKHYWNIEEAIAEIKRIGGAAVLAHPTSISGDHHQLTEIICSLSKLGLDGVEVYNNMAFADQMERLRRLAEELGLLITAGSDYHGIEEGLKMGRGRGGQRFNADLLAPLKGLLSNRKG